MSGERTLHPGRPPGTERPTRYRPKLRWELISCGLHGHELVGTDVATVASEDGLVLREGNGVRWHRCLRCDAWLPLPPPADPTRERLAGPDEIQVPLRGKPLRDRFVLRLIALDRLVHILVLAAIAAAVFLFASHRDELHHEYVKILSDLQSGVGGPIFNTKSGLFSDINKLFSWSSTKLYAIGVGIVAYVTVLCIQAVGLWYARRWAEYLTLVETGVLIPFEIYELVGGISPLKIVSLVINLAIVLFLLVSKRLFGIRGGGAVEEHRIALDTGWGALERATPYLDVSPVAPVAPVAPSASVVSGGPSPD